MGDGSTGGTSQRCGNPPVFNYSSFLVWLREHGYRVCSAELPLYLFSAYGFQRLVPYFGFLEGERVPAKDRTLETIRQLVELDGRLQALLIRWIGAVEVQVKSQYCQAMLDECGPYCLYDDSLFRSGGERTSCQILIEADVRRHVRNNAGARRALETDDGRIPIWVATEAMTFGSFRRLYNNTEVAAVSTRVASSFSVSKRCFRSWLRMLVQVRNCCAHFNPYVVRKQIPAVPKPVLGDEDDNASPLYVLVVLDRLLRGRSETSAGPAYDDWRVFRQEAEQLIGAFALQHPALAVALRMPIDFVEAYAERHLPIVKFIPGQRRVVIRPLSAAA